MFTTLLESRAIRRERRAPWTAASTVMHAAMVAAVATVSAGHAARTASTPAELPPLQWVRAAPVAPSTATAAIPVPTASHLIAQVPVPDIPVVARVDATLPFDARSLAPREIFGETESIRRGGGQGITPGDVHLASAVERQVAPFPGNGQPRYPHALRAASLEGDVHVRFVVDTAGAVERASITIVAASHALFADAVRAWLPATRYMPAAVGGRGVRQLVEQRIQFSLTR